MRRQARRQVPTRDRQAYVVARFKVIETWVQLAVQRDHFKSRVRMRERSQNVETK
jgi:hypothetical protein